MTRLIRALVDTAALRHNLGTIRAYAPGSRVMAVVKANAYGHGLVSTALALADADSFAVARLDEGIALRSAGVRAPIVLLEGIFNAEQLAEAAHHRFELVVHDPLQIKLLEAHRDARRFIIWIKMDTGMNRLGFRPEAFAPALARMRALTVPALELRVMTHLARADERNEPMTREQIAKFEATLAATGLTGAQRLATSIGNSAGTLGWPQAHGDWVRPGLALYGVSPFAGETAEKHGLRPVMTLETTVLTVREVKRGETVGYAGAWRAPRDSAIAILAAGYGDGLPRHLDNGTPVLIGGARYPLVGRVSMDMIAVDVTGALKLAVGNKAIIWGEGLAVEEVATHADTIPYELLCGVSQRVPLELQ
ncbi:MAG TPA: alanine racemase [Steroidobacteraceae bacterium]|nr:alanine racemase [Steroidobacteraceae bacterium]